MSDTLEARLVAALCRDGRADLASIASEVDVAVRTVQDRLETLEADGTIEGYTARVDPTVVDCVTVVLELSVPREHVADVTARLHGRPGALTVYETTGTTSVVAVCRFADETTVAERVCELHADPDVEGVAVSGVRSVGCERESPLLED